MSTLLRYAWPERFVLAGQLWRTGIDPATLTPQALAQVIYSQVIERAMQADNGQTVRLRLDRLLGLVPATVDEVESDVDWAELGLEGMALPDWWDGDDGNWDPATAPTG